MNEHKDILFMLNRKISVKKKEKSHSNELQNYNLNSGSLALVLVRYHKTLILNKTMEITGDLIIEKLHYLKNLSK